MAPASDDRERNFEKALARHFRSGAPAEASAFACGDVEALAAYHEGALAPEQRSLWQSHVATCARCQEILSHLQATDAIPLDVARPLHQGKQPGVPVLKPRAPSLWRWAVPAGALAAGLLVWVTVRQNKPIEIAEVRKAASSAPQPPSPQPLVSESKPPSVNEPSSTRARSSAPVGGVLQQNPEPRRAAKLAATPPKPATTGDRGQTTQNSATAYLVAPQAPAVAGNAGAAAEELQKKAPAFLPPSPSPVPPPPQEAAPRIPSMTQTVTVESAAAAAQTEDAEVANSLSGKREQDLALSARNFALLNLAKDSSAVIISAPHSSTQWRAGSAGLIARSKDAGVHWSLQSSGVITDLLAGSATSKKICWLVGRAGTILRTTDGGAHWSKLPPPVVDDFVSVFAVNARQATISVAHGTYQTVDAGATWQKLPPD